jgi:hypothetical protein
LTLCSICEIYFLFQKEHSIRSIGYKFISKNRKANFKSYLEIGLTSLLLPIFAKKK